MTFPAPLRAIPALALALAAACADLTEAPPPVQVPTSAAVTCRATVADQSIDCGGVPGGARFQLHTLGGQGIYVRLVSSNVSYAAGVFSFDVTVQNLSDIPMATADGATRHGDGVRVFFNETPTVTGGTGDIAVANPDGLGTFTGAGQPYFQYGGAIGGVDQGELGADGLLFVSETSSAKSWELLVPPTATTFTFVLYVSTQTPAGAIATAAPQVTSVSPATLVPGETATLTGINFSATPGDHTVTIGGVAATVTSASPTQLQVTIPCVGSGSVPVQVARASMKGAALNHPLQVTQHVLDAGETAILGGAGEADCNEIAPDGHGRYVVAVYNTGTNPFSATSFQFSGDGSAAVGSPAAAPRVARAPMQASPRPSLDAALELTRARREDAAHARVMEFSRRENERLRVRFAGDPRMRAAGQRAPAAAPPATRTFRVVDIEAGSCNSYFSVNATLVYADAKIAIYEDDANTITDAGNATLATYYDAIGAQYTADMEPIIRNNFGDPLLRDAATDNDGLLVALFTRVVNDEFPGVAGFVVSCDQFPSEAGNLASNHGQYFYALVPTSTTPGFGSGSTIDSWYRTIRSTFIHETKHVASQSARVASSAPFESSWLEEGTARHAEELWARTSVYGVAWKGNTGYGSGADFNSIYCDVRPSTAGCTAANPRRPSLNMFRHFSALYTFMDAPESYSPFGRTPVDGSNFYAVSWSLVRYAIDRYGASDAAFLTALTSSTQTGTANLAGRAGTTIEQLMGGWALSLYADDFPGGTTGPDMDMPTWNFDNIYAGLNADFGGATFAYYPLVPQPLSFGTVAPITVPTIYGGGVSYFEFVGTPSQAQLLRLEASGGGSPPSTLRMAIGRIQ